MSGEVGKQGNFLVDTKSTCFICLEEIPAKFLPIIDLDTGKEEASTVLLQEEQPCLGVCMEKIFKYLDIDPGAILGKQRTGGLGWAASQLMNTNIRVSVCGKCERTTANLTDMIKEKELLEKQIFAGFGNLKDVLKVTLGMPVRETFFGQNFATPVDILQQSIATELRRATVTKCEEHIYKLSQPEITSAPPQPTSQSTFCKLSLPPGGNVQLLNDDVIAKVVVPAKYKCIICDHSSTSMKVFQDHARNKHNLRVISDSSNPKLACNICVMEIPSKKYWSSHTNKKCHAYMISSQTINNMSGDQQFTPHFKCSDCDDEFPSLEGFETHIQCFCKHRPSSTSNYSGPAKRLRPSNLAGKYTCPVCKKSYAQSPSLVRHRHGSPKCRANLQNPECVECVYCAKLLSCRSALQRHMRQNCVKFREIISQQQENGQTTPSVVSSQELGVYDDWNCVMMEVEVGEYFVVKTEVEENPLFVTN